MGFPLRTTPGPGRRSTSYHIRAGVRRLQITRWEVAIDAGGGGRWRDGEGRGWGDGLPSHLDASRDRVHRCTEPLGVLPLPVCRVDRCLSRPGRTSMGTLLWFCARVRGWSVLVSWYKSARSWISAVSDLTGRRAHLRGDTLPPPPGGAYPHHRLTHGTKSSSRKC